MYEEESQVQEDLQKNANEIPESRELQNSPDQLESNSVKPLSGNFQQEI